MKKILIFGIVFVLLVSPSLSSDTLQKHKTDGKGKSTGKALIAAGCTIFACSMAFTLLDQRTKNGHFCGSQVTYQDYKTHYLIGDAAGVLLFSIGAFLYYDDSKRLQVSAGVKKEETVVRVKFSF